MGKRSRAARRNHVEPAPIVRVPLTAQGKWDGSSIPDVSDSECAFPTRWRELLPPMSDLTDAERNGRGPFCDALSSIFFSGGKLADFGITPKAGTDMTKVHRYIRATLGDFGPPHKHKIGGIAHALSKWCTITPARR